MKKCQILLPFITVMVMFTSVCQSQDNQQLKNHEDQPLALKAPAPDPVLGLLPLSNVGTAFTSDIPLTPLVAGTYDVGDDQPVLKKLKDVAAQLNSAIVTGNIIYELNASYDGTTGEVYPVVFTQFSQSGGNWTVTIRVKSGVSARTTSGNSPSPLITFDGADNIILDGRPGGSGSAVSWNIRNSNTGGNAIGLMNDAQANTIRYCDLVAVNPTSGVVVFGSTTGNQGNDNNTISNSNIHDDGTNYPGYGIYSAGKITSIIAYNSGNTVNGCNIFNMYVNGSWCEGIYLEEGSTTWTITGNSFYQTVARSPTLMTNFSMIDIYCGDGYTITGNYMGGSAPQCGGTPLTINGLTIDKTFYGIWIGGATLNNTPNSIQGNTITNIYFEFNNSLVTQINLITFGGILVCNGINNIGNVTPNIIGAASGNGAIVLKTGPIPWSIYSVGIYSLGMGGLIQNNVIGGISFSGNPANYVNLNLLHVQVQSMSDLTISGNLVGSLTTPGSIQLNSTGTGHMRIYAYSLTTGYFAPTTVTQNTAANIVMSAVGNLSTVRGIIFNSSYPGNTFTQNVVRDMSNNAPNVSTGGQSAMYGMQFLISNPVNISRNSVYNLSCTNATSATLQYGFFLQSGSSPESSIIERNFIHSLTSLSNSTSSNLYGIYISGGNWLFKNNMTRLGIKPDGTGMSNGCQITGILEAAGNQSYYNNSIYIGGTVSSGATGSTYCYYSTTATNAKNLLGNIFYNARSGGTTGKHYAVRITGTGVRPAGVNSNYNILLANGASGGTLGHYNGDQASLQAWKSATGMDMTSGSGNPNFISPAGTSATVDLHVQSPTPAEKSGIELPEVTDDFDGQSRSSLTPPDIGADAGDFTSSGDIFGPNIIYTTLANGNTSNRYLADFAVITDNTGIAGSMNRPRFYFKKSTDANVFGPNASTANGWKFVLSDNLSSPYSFMVDYSLINGGGVSAGDIIQYFIAAQDIAGNLSSCPQGLVPGALPPIQNPYLAPATLNQYTIRGTAISGSVNIPGNYPTLTGTGGLFEAINNGLVTGNIIASITGDLTEPGTIALNEFNELPPKSNFTLTIRSDAAVVRSISGATAGGMIKFDGADRVTIDGRHSGSGRYLRFRNTNTGGPTFALLNDACSNTIRNCYIEGNITTATSGVILIGTTTANPGNGNDNNTITENIIRDRSDASGVPYTLVCSIGTANAENSGNSVINNELFNFSNYGINATATGNGNNWTISGNSFYCNLATPPATAQSSINFIPGVPSSGNTVSNNYIGGSSAGCGGMAWTNSGAVSFNGIYLNMGKSMVNNVQNNTIRNIALTNPGNMSFIGLYTGGWINVTGNTVGNPTGTASISIAGKSSTATSPAFTGISIAGNNLVSSTVQNNQVNGIALSNVGSAIFQGMYTTAGLLDLSNNIIGSASQAGAITISGTGAVTALYCGGSGTFHQNLVSNILQSGPNPGNFFGFYLTIVSQKTIDANSILNCGPGSTSVSSGDVVGIYYSGASAIAIKSTLSNNLISLGHGITNNSVYKGIDDYGSLGNNLRVCYNSIWIGGTCSGTSNSYCYVKTNDGIVAQLNNIYYNSRVNSTGSGKHYAMGVTNIAGVFNSDYNDLYAAAAPLIRWDLIDYNTLSDWQANAASDLSSKSFMPGFYSTTDFHTCNQALQNAGTAIAGITTDFSGTTRGNPPDPGAYEYYIPLPVITGPTAVCAGTAPSLYSTQIGGSAYAWTVSPGGTIVSGAGTSSITVQWITAGAQTVGVTYNSPTGCSPAAPAVLNVTVNSPPVPTITGPASACSGSGYHTYVTQAGFSAYTWTVSPGGTIFSGLGTNQLMVSWNSTGNQQVTVNYSNSSGCTANQPAQYGVVVQTVPGAAGVITGAAAVCAGAQGVNYSCVPVAGAISYSWTLPVGATITAGAGSVNITVDFGVGAASGPITVSGNNLCGNGSPSPAFQITVSPVPANAGAVTGAASVCKGSSGHVYTVAPIANATGYTWTLPAGASIITGQNSNSITVSFGTSAVSGTITVLGTNNCGSGAASPNFAVTVNAVPLSPVVIASGNLLTSSAISGNQWYYDNTGAIPGANGQTYLVTNNTGWYWCTASVNGCTSEISNKVYVLVTGTPAPGEQNSFSLWPVPTSGRITIVASGITAQTVRIVIHDLAGRKVSEYADVRLTSDQSYTINLDNAPDGIYTVSIIHDGGIVLKKLIIRK